MFALLQTQSSSTRSTKVSTTTRCLAKSIDLAIVFFASVVLWYPIGVLLGLAYTLAQDGLRDGQSLGKRLFHLKAINVNTGKDCTLRESLIRNAPLGVAVFFGIIPFWGWIILVLLGFPLVGFEIYLMRSQPTGARLGDVMSDTHVVERPKVR